MAELDKNYNALKTSGSFLVSELRKVLDGRNGFVVKSPESQLYQLEFEKYHTLFRVRVELLSDCEESRLGHVRVYRMNYELEEPDFVPFNLLPLKVEGQRHELAFRQVDSRTELDCSGSSVVDGSNFREAYRFAEFFKRVFDSAFSEAKLPIPLHLVGANGGKDSK